MTLAHIHPMLVHFPIVFFLTLAGLDLIAWLRGASISGRSPVGNVAAGLAVLAGISAIATMIFGDMALETAVANGFNEALSETHEGLGSTAAIAFAVWALVRAFVWWRDRQMSRGVEGIAVAVEIVGALLVLVVAYYGGQLVYEFGVNVAHAAG